MPKLISNIFEGRGFFAPTLLAHPKALLVSLWRSSGGFVFLSAGVVAAAVMVVSLLTFLAPDSDRPFIARPVQALQSVLPGVLEQVEGTVAQAATVLGVDQESLQNMRENFREGLAAARSGIIGDSYAPASGSLPAAGTATTTTSATEESSSSPSSSSTMDESSPQMAREPSAPSSEGGAGEASSPAPPTTEAPPPTTSEPTTSPPVTEEIPPVTEEPSPLPPPATEEPPAPPKDEPVPPTAEEPPPPVANQPEA